MPSALVTLLPFLIAFAASAVLTPVARSTTKRLGLYAHPVPDRWHREPVPMLGGVAIVSAFAAGVTLGTDLRPPLSLVLCSGLMFALGAADDVRGIRPPTKLVAQIGAAAVLIYLAPPIDLTGSTVIDTLLAFTWIVGITNAFNLLDNIDGLAAGIATIAGAFYLIIIFPAGSSPMTPSA